VSQPTLVSTRKAAEAAVLTDNDGYKSDIVTPLAIHCGFLGYVANVRTWISDTIVTSYRHFGRIHGGETLHQGRLWRL
jgi:hypothetical protein